MMNQTKVERRRPAGRVEMNRDSAHGFTFEVADARSPYESLCAPEISQLGGQFLYRFGRDSRVKTIGLIPFLVQKRLRTEDAMMRQNAAAQDDRIRPGKAVFADLNRLGSLAACVQIDGVGEQLRTKSADRGERADAHAGGAVEEMPAAYASVILDDQLRAPVRLMREMPARPGRESGDPIELADDGVRAQVEKVEVLAQGQMPDARAFFHNQAAWENPGQPDVAVWMNRIAELLFQERAPHPPRQQQRNK